MNPFTLRGPDFLGFYFIWGIGAFAALWALREIRERRSPLSGTPRWTPGTYPGEGDAYAIALLRGGPTEAARALLGRLVADGHLAVDGRQLKAPDTPPDGSRLGLIENDVLRSVFPNPGSAVEAQDAQQQAARAMERWIAEMQAELLRQGLVPDESQRNSHWLFCRFALVSVPGVGVVKLLVALATGHSNIGILLILIVVYSTLSVLVFRPPRQTLAGRQYLSWLTGSHTGLMQMIIEGRRTGAGELALAAGIYGLEALPVLSPLTTALRPPVQVDSGCSSSGCGSSSCGGGCGGGGCGGGGCGGCGS